ncbi:class I SAM-dependent methyltransferase [Paenibacillus sp. FSL H7-0350]
MASLLRMTFDEAVGTFEDNSIDLLHIDGLHTYEAIKHDYECWLPKLADNSVVLFHDITVRMDDFGVYQL